MLLKTKGIAYLGVLLAINQIILMSSAFFPTNTLFIFGLAGLIVGIVITEFNLTSGISFYIASSLLAFMLAVDKIQIVTYIGFFGLYSIMKYLIEIWVTRKSLSVVIEFILKVAFFNGALILYYFVMREFVLIPITWWLIVLAEVFFFAYDYFFGYFINVYIRSIKPRFKNLR